MSTNLNKPTTPTVIKWTDDEWELIAKQLFETIGSTLLSSEDLSEVKAKNVFLAQQSALPEERHRKLISISQGFQAIRQRLKPILANAANTRQQELFRAQARKAGDDEKSANKEKVEASRKNRATPESTEQPAVSHHSNRVDALPTDRNSVVAKSTSRSDVLAVADVSGQANRADAVAPHPDVATPAATVKVPQTAVNVEIGRAHV